MRIKCMKQGGRLTALALAAALLWSSLPPARAQGVDLRTADVSGHPTIRLAGGFHQLYFDEHTPEQRVAFDPLIIGGSPVPGELLEAAKALDFDRVVDIAKEAMWRWFGPIRMDENGESAAPNISADEGTYSDGNIFGEEISFHFDWRLDPVDNARRLHDFITLVRERRGIDRFNLFGMSGSGPILLAYLKLYGLDRAASVVFDISMHNGTTLFGEIAKRRLVLNADALSKTRILGAIGLDLGSMQPVLRALYETGLLDAASKLLTLASGRVVNRLYDEIIIPLVFTIPEIWAYVPVKDYEAAKQALFRGDPRYAGLVAKLDRYRNEVLAFADEVLLAAAGQVKVGVRAAYGFPQFPVGTGPAVQSDSLVDTAYASLGAVCAPLEAPFPSCYRQKACGGHSHISPDRLIDASACLLPDQTWFARDKPHGTETSYSGWYDWFLRAENATVFGSEKYPQFAEMTQLHVYVPLQAPEPAPCALAAALKAVGLRLLKIWRWLLLLPLFWV
ncbi:MAG: hypothetical protein FWC27_13735 [Firmicutes bacterium]|nr:hypothetical protein [Bacillota bacterium]